MRVAVETLVDLSQMPKNSRDLKYHNQPPHLGRRGPPLPRYRREAIDRRWGIAGITPATKPCRSASNQATNGCGYAVVPSRRIDAIRRTTVCVNIEVRSLFYPLGAAHRMLGRRSLIRAPSTYRDADLLTLTNRQQDKTDEPSERKNDDMPSNYRHGDDCQEPRRC